ncbi:hypothetical protein BJV77DRAFT_961001 [Russula vinacea]|nr:hypothetical protein BJV77DRAFT_961001 [Russula vinacea]
MSSEPQTTNNPDALERLVETLLANIGFQLLRGLPIEERRAQLITMIQHIPQQTGYNETNEIHKLFWTASPRWFWVSRSNRSDSTRFCVDVGEEDDNKDDDEVEEVLNKVNHNDEVDEVDDESDEVVVVKVTNINDNDSSNDCDDCDDCDNSDDDDDPIADPDWNPMIGTPCESDE